MKTRIGIAILAAAVLAIGVSAFSWTVMAIVETDALYQPHHPVSQYTEPMHVKGVVRYVTLQQKQRDDLAHRGFAGGLLLVGLAGVALYLLDKRGNSN